MNSKPTILLLSDDFEAPSGIGTQSKTFIRNTLDKFNWVQLGAATNHPNDGQREDFSKKFQGETGVDDAYVIRYASSGYGDPNKVRRILKEEEIDAILHFTDPRFWQWLYRMESEIHQEYKIPLMYYAIWDNYPYPYWNIGAYSSCDLIMGISKQSHLIHETVLNQHGVKTHDLANQVDLSSVDAKDVLIKYVPHGVDPNVYYPIDETSEEGQRFDDFASKFKESHGLDFIFYWSNRNIGRKSPSQLIIAFDKFQKEIKEEHGKDVAERIGLVMHTQPVDQNGTDLPAIHRSLAPNAKVIFVPDRFDEQLMNFFYNVADVTVNVATNEGFGLSSLESLAAGTPIINNITGGLQDQCRFEDEDGNWYSPTLDVPSNHTGTYKNHGKWAFPIFPKTRIIKGSVPTPYIFDDIPDIDDIAAALKSAYSVREELDERGEAGRIWVLGEESKMSGRLLGEEMSDAIKKCLEAYRVDDRYDVVEHKIINYTETGII